MKKQQLEYLALEIISRVKAGQKVEDTTVELKAEWPKEPRDAARRIAGHANAARGEPITWLIGLDEKSGVVGAEEKEFANWWPQIRKHFDDDVSPDLITHVSIRDESGKSVVAVHFETDRAPYVVKTGHDKHSFEVPWRSGTAIRSVKRNDLLRILVPRISRPDCTLIGLRMSRMLQNQHHRMYRWLVELALYLVPRSESNLYVPMRDLELTLTNYQQPTPVQLSFVNIERSSTSTARFDDTQICIIGPAQLNLVFGMDATMLLGDEEPVEAEVKLRLRFAGHEIDDVVVTGKVGKAQHARNPDGTIIPMGSTDWSQVSEDS